MVILIYVLKTLILKSVSKPQENFVKNGYKTKQHGSIVAYVTTRLIPWVYFSLHYH